MMDTLWTLVYIFFMILFFMIWFMVIMDLFSDHTLNGWGKALWIVFLIIFPPITVLVYLIARGNSMSERRQKQMVAAQEAQKAYIQSAVGTVSPADQIASAKALLDAGTITQAEFDALKTKALA
jgi:ABC-type transport system involved in multi-copper enzyme maturation permease subunit